MGIVGLLARGTARFDVAIGRVRAGAKSAGLEGALSSLGAELKSDVIPERLRDVAGRLAALLGSAGGQASVGAAAAAVPSLEVALDQHAALRAGAASDAVCPFTGLRADEMLGQAAASLPEAVATSAVSPARGAARFDSASSEHTTELSPSAEPTQSAPASVASAEPIHATRVEARGSAREQDVAARAKPPSERSGTKPAEARRSARPQQSSAARAPAKSRRARTETQTDGTSREKRKERLAGASSVANTSGRSATRPAAKRPRSRAENNRKKT